MTLADQQARDRIEHSLGETLFVEAGAGTGKTHQLVQRIVNLIATGVVQANEIAAITFTEKAAAELYDRVLEELDQQRQSATDPARSELFAAAAEQLDHAAIETLHAFAGRILRMHPVEAGLPPGFRIVDESEALLSFNRRWDDALDAILEDESLAEPLLTAFDQQMTLEHLRELARALHFDWDRAESPSAELQPPDLAQSVAEISAPLRAVTSLRFRCADAEDKLAQHLLRMDQRLDEVRDSAKRDPSGAALRRVLRDTEFKVGPGQGGRGAPWGAADQVKEIKDELRGLAYVPGRLLAAAFEPVLGPIHNALRSFVIDYADERRRAGELEFQDLLIRACRVLESNTAVASAIRGRFRRLLIDEFQDNDPLQTRIVDAITQSEPGRAFYVGDPKQSIYRFRRADIQQFNQVKREQKNGLTKLTQNFRSTPAVTVFVNAVFRPLMAEGGADQAGWEDLNPDRPQMSEVAQPVTVVGEEYEGPVDKTRVLEADALARMIADITASQWQVYDKALEGCRDARFADTAVLVPTRTGLRHVLPALEDRNIPYRLESRSLVYDTREIRDLLNLLRAIDDPTDQIALVAALRSPAFACADDDLHRWRQARGDWDYRRPIPRGVAEDDPVADSMRWLNELASRRWQLSVSEVVGLCIRERRLMELAVAERQPRESWARYRFLHDQARAFCDGGGSTLGEFLAWAVHQAEADTQVIESVVPEEDHDAVRIMTVHAAKGLEFPIVIFSGLNTQPRSDPPWLLWGADGRPEVRLGADLMTPGFSELREREEKLQRDEYVRRNYVAATRARDHLIVSLYRKTGRQCDAQLIAEALQASAAPCRILKHDEIPEPPAIEAAPEPEPDQETWTDRQEWIAQRADALRRLSALPHESATGVAKLAAGESAPSERQPNHEPDPDLPPWRRGRAGTAIGRATHAVLQVVDLRHYDESEIRQAANAQAAAESLSGSAADAVRRLAMRATHSHVVGQAVDANRYWRELYAAVEVDGVLLDGFIDLLYELPNGNLVVVDYKTDALQPEESVVAAAERYRLQAAAYALILQESLHRTVERCILLFLEPDEAVEIVNLPEAIAEVRTTLANSTQPGVLSRPTA
ncbi:MAG: AAA family ATPase [Chloroflexi bacterium]|nr:AAA family ATPase [Chloroflexota bacterium]